MLKGDMDEEGDDDDKEVVITKVFIMISGDNKSVHYDKCL